jgi:hypothetical protein
MPQATVARLQIAAISVMPRTRPQRSASSESGIVRMATVAATMLTSPPSCASDSVQVVLRTGRIELMIWRDR